ncbi:MFS transporter [Dietzia aurantiaca]|uniref:MFS transporter n=1 Tax=Dietzia aurantiaca TaxID=983873 RepID=A0ABV9PMA5_9ACTN
MEPPKSVARPEPVPTSPAEGLAAQKPFSSRRQLIAAAVGNVVEWYDWAVYSMAAVFFSAHFFPSTSENSLVPLLATLGVFAVGFFMRPIGGLFIGYLADLHGRKRALSLTIVLMGVGSLVIGLTPSYESIGVFAPILLVLARLLQGLSTGGEYTAAATFMVESAPNGKRGFYSSFLYVGALIGNLLAIAVISALLFGFGEDAMRDWAWRLVFIFGSVASIVGFLIRKYAHETHVLEAESTSDLTVTARPRMFDFLRSHPRECLTIVGLNLAAAALYYMWTSFLPTYAKLTTGFDLSQGYLVSAISLAYFIAIQPIAGSISDRFGRKPVLIVFSGGFTLAVIPMLNFVGNSFVSLLVVQLLGFTLLAGWTATSAAVMVELFPARIRATGIGFPYAVTVAVFGGTAPYFVTWLIDRDLTTWVGIYLAVLALVSLICIACMKETSRIELPK